MSTLRLHWHPEDERHGELSVAITSGEFRGRGSAWFKIDQLREFLTATGSYPLSSGDEPKLEGGFYDDGGETLRQCHLSVQLSPRDPLGSICVTVTVATEADRDERQDLQQSLTSRFLVNYADVDRFRAEFTAMLEGRSGEATLIGKP